MDTKELEATVRDATLEYTKSPIDETFVIRQLNTAYRFAFNTVARSDAMRFGQLHPIAVIAGTSEYDLPEQLWGKRFSCAIVPNPTNSSQTPWRFLELPIVDYRRSIKYQTAMYRTAYPEVVSVLNNKLYVFPPSLYSFTMNLIITRKVPPLGIYGGRIMTLGTNKITIDELYDTRIQTYAGDANKGFISVSDGQTGEVKAMYYVSAVAASATPGYYELTLATSPTRTTFLDYLITTPFVPSSWGTISIDDIVTYGYTTATSILGDAYTDFLINWATMKIRGILNETDTQVMEALKLELQSIQSDSVGRERGMKIERNFANIVGSRPVRR